MYQIPPNGFDAPNKSIIFVCSVLHTKSMYLVDCALLVCMYINILYTEPKVHWNCTPCINIHSYPKENIVYIAMYILDSIYKLSNGEVSLYIQYCLNINIVLPVSLSTGDECRGKEYYTKSEFDLILNCMNKLKLLEC